VPVERARAPKYHIAMRQGGPSRFVPELAVGANPFAWLRHLYYRWGLMLFCQTAGLDASLRGARWAGSFLHKNVPLFRDERPRVARRKLRSGGLRLGRSQSHLAALQSAKSRF